MPSIQLNNQSFSIKAVSFGQLTITANINSSLSDIYTGMTGTVYLSTATPTSQEVIVTNVTSPGVIQLQLTTHGGSNAFGVPFDFANYNTGTLYLPAQLAQTDSASAVTVSATTIMSTQTVATAAGTTLLTSVSPQQTVFTGTLAQTVVLPDARTLSPGWKFEFDNNSTGLVTIQTNDLSTLWVISSGAGLITTCLTVATAAGTWENDYLGTLAVSGKELTVNNNLTLAGTDGTTMTFPSVSATIPPSASPTFTGTITRSGIGTPATLPGNSFEAYDTVVGATLQNNIQNLSANGSSSSDVCATADNGSNTANFIDMGINSSGYNDAGYTSGGADDSYLLAQGGNLGIITGTATKTVSVYTGGTLAANKRATINDSGLVLPGYVSANGLVLTVQSIATAAGTTTLTATSPETTIFTGASAQTCVLPAATTLLVGQTFTIFNTSTGLVTVQTNGAATLLILGASTSVTFTCLTIATAAGTWATAYIGTNTVSGKVLKTSNTLTLAGTDGTTITFPSVSSTIPPVASPTFTGVVTRSGTGTPASLSNLAYQSYDTLTTMFQENIQNLSNGTSASTDLVATADTGSDTINYIDLGINSSAYSDSNYTIGGALAGYVYSNGGDLTVGTATAAKVLKLHTGGTLAANLRATVSDTALTLGTGVALTGAGAITSSGGGIGYATGAGGTGSQSTARTDTVTINKLCGTITMFSAAQAADAIVTFTLTNSFIAATDYLLVQHTSATNEGAWAFSTVCGAGSSTITIRNVSNASITEATPLKFLLIKAVTA